MGIPPYSDRIIGGPLVCTETDCKSQRVTQRFWVVCSLVQESRHAETIWPLSCHAVARFLSASRAVYCRCCPRFLSASRAVYSRCCPRSQRAQVFSSKFVPHGWRYFIDTARTEYVAICVFFLIEVYRAQEAFYWLYSTTNNLDST